MKAKADLTVDYLRSILSYDEKTGHLIWRVNRKHVKAGMIAGSERTVSGGKRYHMIKVDGRCYGAHHVIFFMMTGRWALPEIDHIDGNGCNNQWSNLREVDGVTNRRNQRRMCRNKSGYTGVCWHKRNQKWEVKIGVNGGFINLGYFDSIDDAIAARKDANQKYGFHPNHGSDRPL
jgi:hypothetical protein